MSFSFNKVLAVGNLTRDPDLKYTPSGSPVCEFGIAMNEGTQEKPKTIFIDVTAWGKIAESCQKYLVKGSPALIEGKLDYNQWEDKQSGQKRSKVSILAQRVQFMSMGKSPDLQSEEQDDNTVQQEQPEPQPRYNPDEFAPPPVDDDDNGEIPF